MTTVEQIEDAVRPILAENGFELIETQHLREAGRWVVRLFLDKGGKGITLDDCQRASDIVGNFLDDSNLVERAYVLEISSPGINRPLKTPAHFKAAVGKTAKISLFAPLTPESLQKNFSGEITHFEGDSIWMEDVTSGRINIPLSAVSKANLDII